MTHTTSIPSVALLLLLATGCSPIWDTPLVVAPHHVEYFEDDCGVDQGSLHVDEMILHPVAPYEGEFELSYVLSGVAYDLTDCTRGSFVGDTIYCDQVTMDGVVEPPLGLIVALSGWVHEDVVDYSLAQGLFCDSDDPADCEGLVPGDDSVCEMSLLGTAAYAE